MSTARRGRRLPEGIRLRHGRSCASGGGAACDCSPSYQAVVRARDGRKLRKSFRVLSDAIAWRDEMRVGVRKRTVISPTSLTFHEYAEQWLEGVRTGTNLTRDLAAYKPSTVRAYAKHIKRIYPALGSMRLSTIELHDLQDEANRLIASGLTASSVRNTFDPVRKIFARAVREHLIAINPTVGLELKAKDGGRSWVDRPERVARALAALDDVDRGPWTVAFYAGLRAGEIQALRWADVDFDRGVLRVERSWDRKAGPIAPKSRAGRRTIPMSMLVRRELRELQLRSGRRGDELVFGRTAELAFVPQVLHRHSKAAWHEAGVTSEWAADGLEPPGLHDARHHCLTHWGRVWDIGRLHQAAGHSDIRQSQRYLHVPPDRDAEDAARLDAYLGAV
jgi:integrase